MSESQQQNLDLEALSKQVAALESQAKTLSAAQARGRNVRTALIVVVALFLGISLYSFYGLGLKVQSKPYLDELLELAQKRLPEQNQLLTEETQKLVNTARPVLISAFNERLRSDVPEYLNVLQSERKQLAENLEQRLRSKLEDQYESLVKKHENLLQEEFPLIKDQELHTRMMANLVVAVDKMVKKYYIDQLEEQFKSLYANWDDFPAAAPADKDDQPLEKELFADLLDLMVLMAAHGRHYEPTN